MTDPEEFKIEQGVPMPPPKHGGNSKYPFAAMQVGDSFAFDQSLMRSVRNAAYAFGKRNGSKFVCREWRCWRTQ